MNKQDVQALRQLLDQYDQTLNGVVALQNPDTKAYVGTSPETATEVPSEKGTAFISSLAADEAGTLESLQTQMQAIFQLNNPYA